MNGLGECIQWSTWIKFSVYLLFWQALQPEIYPPFTSNFCSQGRLWRCPIFFSRPAARLTDQPPVWHSNSRSPLPFLLSKSFATQRGRKIDTIWNKFCKIMKISKKLKDISKLRFIHQNWKIMPGLIKYWINKKNQGILFIILIHAALVLNSWKSGLVCHVV